MDDLDDLLDTNHELEARFRDLQAQVELEELKANGGARRQSKARARAEPKRARTTKAKAKAKPRAEPKKASDPLRDLKDALDGSRPLERYLLVACPSCKRKNRVPLARLRAELPVCGACKEDLAFTRSR